MNCKAWTEMSVDLYRAYSAPERRYHNLDHITELFDVMNKNLDLVENEVSVRLAIWYHDFILDHSDDDEERSATKGYEAALSLGYPETFARIVHRLILVTKHSQELSYLPQTNDEMFMCDIDLVPLAANNFAERTGWVKEEYPDVPPETFFPARRDILRGFLGRPVIYYTPRFQTLYEAKARKNLMEATVE